MQKDEKKFKNPEKLHPGFDICPYWYDGMSWSAFKRARKLIKHPSITKFLDKVDLSKILKEGGFKQVKSYLISRNIEDIKKIREIIEKKKLINYVIKPAHLSHSQGLIIVKDGINIVTGEAISLDEIEKRVREYFTMVPREVESWNLKNAKPGFLFQDLIPGREEIKIQTVWSEAVIGEWRGGEEASETTLVWGRYDKSGKKLRRLVASYFTGAESITLGEEDLAIWKQAIKMAEDFSKKTDALRVDFFVDRRVSPPEIMINEVAYWPESLWNRKEKELSEKINQGYREMCQ